MAGNLKIGISRYWTFVYIERVPSKIVMQSGQSVSYLERSGSLGPLFFRCGNRQAIRTVWSRPGMGPALRGKSGQCSRRGRDRNDLNRGGHAPKCSGSGRLSPLLFFRAQRHSATCPHAAVNFKMDRATQCEPLYPFSTKLVRPILAAQGRSLPPCLACPACYLHEAEEGYLVVVFPPVL
jgi:hypothetical protein